MQPKIQLPKDLVGLTDDQVIESRLKYGANIQQRKRQFLALRLLADLLKDPLLIILIGVSVIYLLLGQNTDAYFMMFAILVVFSISFFQDHRSQTSLKALEALNIPQSQVIRNRELISIPTPEIVPGDMVVNEEGSTLQADGDIMYSHDFSINESSLTGESFPVFKNEKSNDPQVFQGTSVSTGLVVFKVSTTGSNTRLGKLGKSLLEIREERSPLQIQIDWFVKRMSLLGIFIFRKHIIGYPACSKA